MRLGWFTPVSMRSGVSKYSRDVLQSLHSSDVGRGVEVVVFHPETSDEKVELPYPSICLGPSLLASDFDALFDIPVYHLGNNDLHHGPVFQAARKVPGISVLHDFVYQHYLAGINFRDDHVSASYAALMASVGGFAAFNMLDESGVLAAPGRRPMLAPWETQWATRHPCAHLFANLGLGTVVHSAYSQASLGGLTKGPILKLFMPRPAALPFHRTESPARDGITLVFTGHIQETKSLRLLVSAFAQSPQKLSGIRVVLAGYASDVRFLAVLKEQIRASNLQHTFFIIENPDDAELAEIMETADVFYNLRYPNTEGASLSLAEQLSLARPVICYRTGSFAEVPDDICYFVENIGDTRSLLDVLVRMKANPADLLVRGRKAGQYMQSLTNETYASQLLQFIESNARIFSARSALVTKPRREPRTPLSAQDTDWLRSRDAAACTLGQLMRDALVVPPGLLKMSDAQLGQFVQRNIFKAPPDDSVALAIGRVMKNMSPFRAAQVMGIGRFLAALERNEPTGSKRYLHDLILPVKLPEFWKIVTLLPAERAASLAVHALGLAAHAGLVERLGAALAGAGLWQVVNDLLNDEAVNEPLGLGRNVDLTRLIEAEQYNSLVPLPARLLGCDLVTELERMNADHHVVLQGLHAPESNWIWSRTPQASLIIRLPEMPDISRIELDLATLGVDLGGRENLEICLSQPETGELLMMDRVAVQGRQERHAISAAISPTGGLIRLDIRFDKISVPKELGISEDPRPLGVMIARLVLVHDVQQDVNRRPKLTPSGATEAGPMRCSLHTAQPRRASGVSVIRGS